MTTPAAPPHVHPCGCETRGGRKFKCGYHEGFDDGIDMSKNEETKIERTTTMSDMTNVTTDTNPMAENQIKELVFQARKALLETACLVKATKLHSDFRGEQLHHGQHDEMLANLTLAYRHIEDARMRLGKVVQAQDGGVSVYPR